MLLKDGDIEGSIAARREAISLAPKQRALREELIRALTELDREEDARKEQIELALRIADDGKHDDALALLQTLLDADSSNVPARRARAQVYDAMGQDVMALKEYREIEKIRAQGGHVSNFDTSVEDGDAPPPRRPATVPGPAAAPARGLLIMEENTFEQFVVGPRNKFAFATAQAVAADPGGSRNPLFLYAEVGLGKTHLMHAIANEIMKSKPALTVYYTSTEDFTTELLEAIDNNQVTTFRNKHRQADVLLLDDVQFLAGKEKAQEEFFHVFNVLYQARKQIVLTSDRPPKDITHLDARLRSRFGQGVIVDIQPPDLDTRVQILNAESKRRGVDIPGDAVELIARRITTNVRELKGAHNQLLNQHEIAGEPLSATTAAALLDKYYGS
jgi:chromosomal replication initiator protein DnaA